jgi:hypothetical protein
MRCFLSVGTFSYCLKFSSVASVPARSQGQDHQHDQAEMKLNDDVSFRPLIINSISVRDAAGSLLETHYGMFKLEVQCYDVGL